MKALQSAQSCTKSPRKSLKSLHTGVAQSCTSDMAKSLKSLHKVCPHTSSYILRIYSRPLERREIRKLSRQAENPGEMLGHATDKSDKRVIASTGWDAGTAQLIDWFHQTEPPAKPFQLSAGVTVLDPAIWWRAIGLDIHTGPTGSRARTGALQGDLGRLFALRGSHGNH